MTQEWLDPANNLLIEQANIQNFYLNLSLGIYLFLWSICFPKRKLTSQRRKKNTINTEYVALLFDILIFWNVATLLEQGNIVRENPNLSKSNLNNDSHDSVGRTLTLTSLSIYQWPSNTQVQSFICLVSWSVDASTIECFTCAYSNSRVSQRYHQLWQRGIGRVVQLLRDASISCL